MQWILFGIFKIPLINVLFMHVFVSSFFYFQVFSIIIRVKTNKHDLQRCRHIIETDNFIL